MDHSKGQYSYPPPPNPSYHPPPQQPYYQAPPQQQYSPYHQQQYYQPQPPPQSVYVQQQRPQNSGMGEGLCLGCLTACCVCCTLDALF